MSETPCISGDSLRMQEYLKGRFVIHKHSGNMKYYYDLQTNNYDLTFGQLIGVLSQKFGCDFGSAKKVVSMTNFLHVHSTKTYFRPNAARIISTNGVYFINTWSPSRIEPLKHFDASPFVEFLELAVGEENADYIILQLALAYQKPHPHPKPPIAMYLYSSEQGQGKTTLSDIIKEVFGKASHKVINTHKPLRDKNAVQFWGQTWLVCEEAKVERTDNLYDQLKQYITGTTTTDSLKFGSPQEFECPARLIMLSNRPPTFLDKDDRRFFIAEWDTGLRGEEKDKYFNKFRNWLAEGGYAHIAGFIQSYDVSEYDFASEAPKNADKHMILDTYTDPLVEKFLDLINDCELPVFYEQHWDVKQFIEDNNIKASQAIHIFHEAGFIKSKCRIQIEPKKRCRIWYPKSSKLFIADGRPAEIKLEDGSTHILKELYGKSHRDW
jgi:hypothetical protein